MLRFFLTKYHATTAAFTNKRPNEAKAIPKIILVGSCGLAGSVRGSATSSNSKAKIKKNNKIKQIYKRKRKNSKTRKCCHLQNSKTKSQTSFHPLHLVPLMQTANYHEYVQCNNPNTSEYTNQY